VTEKFSLLGGFRYQYDWVKASFQSIIDPAYAPGTVVNGIFVTPYTPVALKSARPQRAAGPARQARNIRSTAI
jgi:iron complex outermembrane receptor protein